MLSLGSVAEAMLVGDSDVCRTDSDAFSLMNQG